MASLHRTLHEKLKSTRVRVSRSTQVATCLLYNKRAVRHNASYGVHITAHQDTHHFNPRDRGKTGEVRLQNVYTNTEQAVSYEITFDKRHGRSCAYLRAGRVCLAPFGPLYRSLPSSYINLVVTNKPDKKHTPHPSGNKFQCYQHLRPLSGDVGRAASHSLVL